jgi:hypothetical protein
MSGAASSRRNILWIKVPTNPTAQWLCQQIAEAFPWDTAPEFLIRDNNGAHGEVFTRRLRAIGSGCGPTDQRHRFLWRCFGDPLF